MPAPTDPLELRHRPIQTRGIVRFDAILNAGRGLLADEGLERFTMEDVATRAGVPIGSVYQYFPNKYALVAEMATQDTQALVTALDEAAGNFPTQDWQQQVDHLIEYIARVWAEHPWRPAVYAAMRSTAATRQRARENSEAIARAAIRPLSALNPDLDVDRLYRVAIVIVEAGQTLLNLAVQSGTLDDAILYETKRLTRAYLRSVALSHA